MLINDFEKQCFYDTSFSPSKKIGWNESDKKYYHTMLSLNRRLVFPILPEEIIGSKKESPNIAIWEYYKLLSIASAEHCGAAASALR